MADELALQEPDEMTEGRWDRELGELSVAVETLKEMVRDHYCQILAESRRGEARFEVHAGEERKQAAEIWEAINEIRGNLKFYGGAVALAAFCAGIGVTLLGIWLR